ncbi:nebulin-like [Xenentodon cancila]
MEFNKTKAKANTLPYDSPYQQHMKMVKDITSNLKYKEVYEKSKAHINMDPEAQEIRAAEEAYKNITNLDYKKKYEATKYKWIWTADRPDFVNAVKNSLQQSDVEYKYDREMLKGCVIPVKYKEKYEKVKGHYVSVLDPPQILHAKAQ